jgi:carbamoyltransferase
MVILGINGLDDMFHDSSAALVVDGKIAACVEEERFDRRKHSSGLPLRAIDYCVRKAGAAYSAIDHVGYYLDPDVLLKTFYTEIVGQYAHVPRAMAHIAAAADRARSVEARLRETFPLTPSTCFHFLNHHLCHAASAFYISGFERAAVLTIDGSGERESCTLYAGGPDGLRKVHDFLLFPQSLGFVYNVVAAHLGLTWVSGPGKLMGLAGHGIADPHLFDDIIRLRDDCCKPVEIDLSFCNPIRMAAQWSGWKRRAARHEDAASAKMEGARVTSYFSAAVRDRFGPAVPEGGGLDYRHSALAASMQVAIERAILHIVHQVTRLLPDETKLCLAGGVALNIGANRRIVDSGLFERTFITPPAYDGGTSLGCALELDSRYSGRRRYDFDVYCGPDIERDFDIAAACASFHGAIRWEKLSEGDLVRCAADALAAHKLIGWVQGRMECGPRALGNRSILANPASPTVKHALDSGVKKREPFRPYAPSILQEESAEWFDIENSPFMLLEATVRHEKRARVPGIVHVDGTSRPQTVSYTANPRYYRLIRAFFERTGIPMVLNTSFNLHDEPIVNRPEEAIKALIETELDALFIGPYLVRRAPAAMPSGAEA